MVLQNECTSIHYVTSMKLIHYPNTSDLWQDSLSLFSQYLIAITRSYTRNSALCTFSLSHKHGSDSAQLLMTHLSSNISHSIHSLFSWMACENLRQRISHWLRLSGPVFHMSQGRWMNGLISPAPLLTVCAYGCVRVFLQGDWMAVPLLIVEIEGSSSYTLIMALRWRIPEASSLIDSSVPFLPRPRSAESCYCPTTGHSTQASKQPGSHSCALYMHSMHRCFLSNIKSTHEPIA